MHDHQNEIKHSRRVSSKAKEDCDFRGNRNSNGFSLRMLFVLAIVLSFGTTLLRLPNVVSEGESVIDYALPTTGNRPNTAGTRISAGSLNMTQRTKSRGPLKKEGTTSSVPKRRSEKEANFPPSFGELQSNPSEPERSTSSFKTTYTSIEDDMKQPLPPPFVGATSSNGSNSSPSSPQSTTASTGTKLTMVQPRKPIVIPTASNKTIEDDAESAKRIQLRTKLKQWLANNSTVNTTTTTTTISTPGAFIHIGKTGGSSLAGQLRNGCHSFVKKPCHKIPINEETLLSQLTTYYHVPDFPFLRQQQQQNQTYVFYVITLRDPFERLLSTFTFQHYQNILTWKTQKVHVKVRLEMVELFLCFPTLEIFSKYLSDASQDYIYKNESIIDRSNCTNLARAMMNGKVQRSIHFYWNIQKIHSILLQGTGERASSIGRLFDDDGIATKIPPSNMTENEPTTASNATWLVIRQEHLWDDWKTANEYLGDPFHHQPQSSKRTRDYSSVKLKVTKNVSHVGRRYLCLALQDEYKAYFHFLQLAGNLNDTQKQDSRNLGRQNCPEVVDLLR